MDKVKSFLGTFIKGIIILIPLLLSFNLIDTNTPTMRQMRYQLSQQLKIKKAPQITVSDKNLRGNTQSNIQNHGTAVENEDYIFYINDRFQIFRAEKDFSNPVVLLYQTQGYSYSNLNVIEDWLYYHHKNTFYRMDLDGNNNTEVFTLSGMSRPHIIGSWIYFYTYNDKRIYKMDINGNNLQVLNDVPTYEMTVYQDKIFYCFNIDETYFLRSMGLDGQNKEPPGEIGALKMVVQDDYVFYVDAVSHNLCRWDMVNKERKDLTQQNVLNFSVDGEYIYYNHWSSEQYGYPGQGLYRMDINGEDLVELSNDFDTGHFSITEEWIIYDSSQEKNESPTTKRMCKETGEITQMGYRY